MTSVRCTGVLISVNLTNPAASAMHAVVWTYLANWGDFDFDGAHAGLPARTCICLKFNLCYLPIPLTYMQNVLALPDAFRNLT